MWTCSMHPQIKQPNPGQCPLCGMDLIPLQSSPEDTGAVQLTMSEAAEKLAEIQTVPVQRAFAEHALRLVGKVEYDETRLKSITAWFAGRIDRLFVDYTGTPVKQGDHLVELFSPALLTDQEALLQAVRAAQAGGAGSVAVRQNRGDAAERARERLRLLGLTPDQITAIETRGTPSERITFYSPITGIVIQKNAVQGEYVQMGTRIYTIADLTHVWIKMDAYESDLPWIHYGQPVTFTTVSYPGEIFQGQVVFIDPFLDEQTRTVKVRVDVVNPQGKLKPGMFVQAVLRSEVNAQGKVITAGLAGQWICPMHPSVVREEKGRCDQCEMSLVRAEESGYGGSADSEKNPPLLIPLSAPLITGTRAVVYVKIPNTEKPVFEGREVVLGPRLEHAYVVLAGLEEGEQVVTKGNFKIDSALQINTKPSMMSETAPDMQAMPEGQQDHPAGMHGDGPPLSLESLP
ncbi:MAG: efflux RND transporter periplasmic adaptor subunit, partial [bacterium]|nr:efflux RND transporter periplasmic adaptor subunit [bacterium]